MCKFVRMRSDLSFLSNVFRGLLFSRHSVVLVEGTTVNWFPYGNVLPINASNDMWEVPSIVEAEGYFFPAIR